MGLGGDDLVLDERARHSYVTLSISVEDLRVGKRSSREGRRGEWTTGEDASFFSPNDWPCTNQPSRGLGTSDASPPDYSDPRHDPINASPRTGHSLNQNPFWFSITQPMRPVDLPAART